MAFNSSSKNSVQWLLSFMVVLLLLQLFTFSARAGKEIGKVGDTDFNDIKSWSLNTKKRQDTKLTVSGNSLHISRQAGNYWFRVSKEVMVKPGSKYIFSAMIKTAGKGEAKHFFLLRGIDGKYLSSKQNGLIFPRKVNGTAWQRVTTVLHVPENVNVIQVALELSRDANISGFYKDINFSEYVKKNQKPTTYYIDSKLGNDNYTGTSKKVAGNRQGPWQSLEKVLTHSMNFHFIPGDKILFKAGGVYYTDYASKSFFGDSGSDAAPIEFNLYGKGAKPVWKFGALNISHNLKDIDQDGIYETTDSYFVPMDLYENGMLMKKGQNKSCAKGIWFSEKKSGNNYKIYYKPTRKMTKDIVVDIGSFYVGSNDYSRYFKDASYIKISNFRIESSQRGLTFAAKDKVISNITVSNCLFFSGRITFNVDANYGFSAKNIRCINNDFFYPTRGPKTSLQVRKGYSVENLEIAYNRFFYAGSNWEALCDWEKTHKDLECIYLQNVANSRIHHNDFYDCSEIAIIHWMRPKSGAENNSYEFNRIFCLPSPLRKPLSYKRYDSRLFSSHGIAVICNYHVNETIKSNYIQNADIGIVVTGNRKEYKSKNNVIGNTLTYNGANLRIYRDTCEWNFNDNNFHTPDVANRTAYFYQYPFHIIREDAVDMFDSYTEDLNKFYPAAATDKLFGRTEAKRYNLAEWQQFCDKNSKAERSIPFDALFKFSERTNPFKKVYSEGIYPHRGYLKGEVQYINRKNEYAVKLGGKGVVELHNPNYDLNGDLTVAFWINPEAGILKQDFTLIEKGNREGEFYIGHIANEPGRIYYSHGTGEPVYLLKKGTLQENNWQHIAIVRDAAKAKITVYYNGKIADIKNYSSNALKSTSKIIAGKNFHGGIDEIVVNADKLNQAVIGKCAAN